MAELAAGVERGDWWRGRSGEAPAWPSGQVANQARIFALAPEYRSRLNTAYMTCAFLGGSAGSWLGVRAFQHFGWQGVCILVAALALATLLWNLPAHSVRPRQAT